MNMCRLHFSIEIAIIGLPSLSKIAHHPYIISVVYLFCSLPYFKFSMIQTIA